MAILNPRYSFLEADFRNLNLKIEQQESQGKKENQDVTTSIVKIEEGMNLPPKPPSFYVKSYPLFLYGNTVSADIYSAALFLLIKNL